MSVQSLIAAVLDEADLIDDLTEIVVEQRESVKGGNYLLMQDLMKKVQEIFFKIQVQDLQRSRLSEALAKEFSCNPQISALAAEMTEGDRLLFMGAGDRLKNSVFMLKSEMAILGSLVDQNERLSAMLLSEWRRLEGGISVPGGLDFRG